ncbi:HAMP domain-containing protein [Rudanella paleaurantiibacter]|uniref:histidine kinase n=1 Tax=Rudanella paleaurantiibacter TaxID=2614655 RepID=A0A7J5TU36_9BACT|nr:HAMP domain-containing sensor histidine kinase [Rudanella paleaurantiibacter]KAB7727377.1 HAMP domain-containing protein [Rudanella paleaurantiibacter]
MNTRTRFALILVVYSLTLLTLFGAGVYLFQNNFAYVDFYKRLETRATISARYNLKLDSLNSESYRTIREKHLERLDQEREYLIPVSNDVLASRLADSLMIPETLITQILAKGRATAREGATFYAGIREQVGRQRYVVVVSANNYYINNHLNFLRNILGVGILLSSVIVIYLSVYFSRHVFEPIRQITNKVRQISTENIHLRLEENEYRNEVGELSSTFNHLLNRIETALEVQKNFISNASHELATPLTAIIGEADVTLIRERTPAEYQQTLRTILTQAERLNDITRSLLSLAQLGFKNEKLVFEIVRMDELIWEAKTIIDKLNPQNNIRVDLGFLPDDPRRLKVNGNRQLLQLALVNLLSNACKYSYNKPVSVHIAAGTGQVVIAIIDQGVGIPDEEIRFIYDPFFRASNTKLFEGYGIGLPLARNIIVLHQGTLNVTSKVDTGTTVQIRLPSII